MAVMQVTLALPSYIVESLYRTNQHDNSPATIFIEYLSVNTMCELFMAAAAGSGINQIPQIVLMRHCMLGTDSFDVGGLLVTSWYAI
jgi:hypothetical protein